MLTCSFTIYGLLHIQIVFDIIRCFLHAYHRGMMTESLCMTITARKLKRASILNHKTYIFQGGRLQFVVILSILNFPFLF